jgi:hypothetical protein
MDRLKELNVAFILTTFQLIVGTHVLTGSNEGLGIMQVNHIILILGGHDGLYLDLQEAAFA